MDIVLAVHHFPPRYIAGAELYTYRLARGLIRLGHRVEVVCVESVTEGTLEPRCVSGEYEGIPVHRLFFNLALAPDPARWEFWNPQLGAWFRQFLEERQPDLVHFQAGYLLTGSVLEATQALRIPAILTLHDYWFLCPRIHLQRPDGSLCGVPDDPGECVWCRLTEKRRYRLPDRATGGAAGRLARGLLFRLPLARLTGWSAKVEAIRERRERLGRALQDVNVLIAPSRFLAQMFVQREGLPPDRIRYLRYGLDHGAIQRPDPPEGDQQSGLRVGYLGQIAPHKGVHVLVEAFRSLGALDGVRELRIYGDMGRFPRYAEQLRRLAQGDPRIRFEGAVENHRVPEVLSGLDVLVVPSIWYENAPLTILEAHAAGVPVLASDLGGMAEMVRHGVDGLLFQVGDARDLAARLRELVENPDLLCRLRAGIGPVRTLEQEREELLEIYRTVTQSAEVWR
ncbi:MAG: glycosyltransferase family 4 protein [Thermoflexales bacterium]|nr:glycosyltransferase family 4 protein [Thermoflexales bacterium]